MPTPRGIRSAQAGKVSDDGFIVPPQGKIEHTFYFTSAPSALVKAEELIAKGRVHFPAAIVINDETIGRRTGSKAVPRSWFADNGSIAAAFAFASYHSLSDDAFIKHGADAVIDAFNAFRPTTALDFRRPNDFYIGDRKAGRVTVKRNDAVDFAVIHLNCTTDFAKAPAPVVAIAVNLVDFIEVTQLPMSRPGALSNILLQNLMTSLPRELERPT